MVLPTLGRAYDQRSFASYRAQDLPYGAPGNGRVGCDTGAALADSRRTSLLPAMDLLKEVDIIKTFFCILVIVIGRYPRRSISKLHGQHGFGPVDK
jgi:hypothetical protein